MYGVFASAVATTGHTGVIVGLQAVATVVGTSGISYVINVQYVGHANQGVHIEPLTPGDTLDYGVAISSNALIGTAAFRYDQRAGSTANAFQYKNNSGGDQFVVDSSGNVNIAATKVLSTRRTGWTAWTNTKTRTTFDTTTATLPQVGAAVGAIIDDLIAHGIIGA
jgi:hypothetical protein